ncbi:MAG: pyruvate formate-lyase-activating protein [Clostridia bacterium]
MIGKIHSIESLSTVDGPGIRYVVFMQGCELRCSFCHNVDTWEKDAGKEISSDELVKKILQAKEYIKTGGVTFTGGEPLLQAKFLNEVCIKLKKNNINVVIDTAGNFDTDDKDINDLLENVDLVLFDIKHIDTNEHKKLVGVTNEKILKMAKYISNIKKVPMWIRIVYIPGITDIGYSLQKCKEFIGTLNKVEKVEILPYHEMGKYKWKELGIKYRLNNIKIPTEKECTQIENFINNK